MEDTTPIRRLPEDTIADILLRLPSKYILRSGAVCTAWRRITTAPHFLSARSRRQQPVSILAHAFLAAAPWACGDDGLLAGGSSSEDTAVEALPVASPEYDRRRLVRYPATIPAHCGRLLASCAGVLLFKKATGHYLLCNPVARRWAELPRLPDEYCRDADPEYGFYFHQPSGEFRLLCCSLRRRIWYVVSTGAAGPRHLKANPDPDLITRFARPLLTTAATPVALHGNLHWPPLWLCAGGETRITAFNTVSETFQQMAGPTSRTPRMVKLFEMGGLLAAADFGEEKHVDLWFLEDYNAERWALSHRVASPWKHGSGGRPRNRWGMQSVAVASDDEGNVIVGNNDGLVVYSTRMRKTVRTVDSAVQGKNRVFVSMHVFKGSLVQHPCFVAPTSADFPLIIHSWS
ncbi:putative F-box protein [Panicum miliaceum]|uniref:F-box protein n=1 Tax=Panicum miliaceum TaxID=4540 RepID=A0A3L6T6Q1_PANMI|nr:putative F-box protein [Panicum miliaceum]